MKIFEILKLDKWYGVLLYLGALIMAGALFSSAEFIQMNHLLGLGIGVVMIGVSCWIAEKHINIPYNLGMLSTTVIKHTLVSGFILAIGIGLTGLFGFLIVKNLI